MKKNTRLEKRILGRKLARELTRRELEVLEAITHGKKSRRIAEDLNIAERTVKAHLASIYAKLDVDSRVAAVAKAIRRGLVPDG